VELAEGTPVALGWAPGAAHLFDATTETRCESRT